MKKKVTTTHEYYTDTSDRIQGVYQRFETCDMSGARHQRSNVIYLDGTPHGEYIAWNDCGNVIRHKLYINGRTLLSDVSSLTEEDKFELALIHGDIWLNEEYKIHYFDKI